MPSGPVVALLELGLFAAWAGWMLWPRPVTIRPRRSVALYLLDLALHRLFGRADPRALPATGASTASGEAARSAVPAPVGPRPDGRDAEAGFAVIRPLLLVVAALLVLLLVPMFILGPVTTAYLVWRAWPSIRRDVRRLWRPATGRRARRGGEAFL